MSQTEKSSPSLFKALCVVLLVTTIGGIAGTAYFYNQFSSEQSKNTTLQGQYDALKTLDTRNNQTIAANNAQIASLNGQLTADRILIANYSTWVHILQGNVAALQAQAVVDKTTIDYLNGQITGYKLEISKLQSSLDAANVEIATLKAEITKLTDVDWTTGQVSVSSVCGFFATCTPLAIEFNDHSRGIQLSSVINPSGGYSLWLLNGVSYNSITVVYSQGYGAYSLTLTCHANPSSLTPTTNPTSQYFVC